MADSGEDRGLQFTLTKENPAENTPAGLVPAELLEYCKAYTVDTEAGQCVVFTEFDSSDSDDPLDENVNRSCVQIDHNYSIPAFHKQSSDVPGPQVIPACCSESLGKQPVYTVGCAELLDEHKFAVHNAEVPGEPTVLVGEMGSSEIPTFVTCSDDTTKPIPSAICASPDRGDDGNCEVTLDQFSVKRDITEIGRNVTKIKDELHVCLECGKVFEDDHQLTCHEREHASASTQPDSCQTNSDCKMFECNLCGASFSHLHELQNHEMYCKETPNLTAHKKEKTPKVYLCEICHSTFKTKKDLQKHKRLYVCETRFKCPFCDGLYTQKHNVRRHCKRKHCATGQRDLNGVFKQVYLCHSCKEVYQGIKAFQNHKTSHLPRPFKCTHCENSFRSKSAYSHHQKLRTAEGVCRIYLCLICEKKFETNKSLQKHERSLVCEMWFKCSTCGNLCEREKYIEDPSEFKHSATGKCDLNAALLNVYRCHSCQEIYEESKAFQKHKRSHWLRPFKCSYCNKSFRSKKECSQHQRLHTDNKRYKCPHCDRMFMARANLRDHERRHLGIKPYKCRYCDKAFERGAVCIAHERMHTGEKPLKCQFCVERFPYYALLKAHELLHQHGKKSFKCGHCSKGFSRLEYMKAHERTHLDDMVPVTGPDGVVRMEKNPEKYCYTCRHCSEQFSGSLQRWQHEFMHRHGKAFKRRQHKTTRSMERRFKCQFCDKAFKQKVAKLNHERIHTGEKPFKCRFCESAFATLSARISHERIHTGEKPFKCRFCESAFVTSSARISHERVHTGEKPHHCQFCSESFQQLSTLNNHMRTHSESLPNDT